MPRCVVLIGAAGRMGQALLQAAPRCPALAFTAAIASEGSAAGAAAPAPGGALHVPARSAAALARARRRHRLLQRRGHAAQPRACRAAGKPLLIGTTGLAAGLEAEFDAAARDIALLVAAEHQPRRHVLAELVRLPRRRCRRSSTVRSSRPTTRKRDAPSGTALALGRPRRAQDARHGPPAGAREIDIAFVRAGDIVGEHTVLFAGAGEELTLDAPGHRPGRLCPGRPGGRALACGPAAGALRHAGCCCL